MMEGGVSTLADRAAPARGHFKLNVFRGGCLVEATDRPNLVVDQAKWIQALLLAGAAGSNAISKIGFGQNGTAPAAGNTALSTPFLKSFDAITTTATSVTFSFSLGTSEANGVNIWEFGLVTGSGLLYARKTRPVVLAKAADLTLSGTWTISF
jgi:hypothetical protein